MSQSIQILGKRQKLLQDRPGDVHPRGLKKTKNRDRKSEEIKKSKKTNPFLHLDKQIKRQCQIQNTDNQHIKIVEMQNVTQHNLQPIRTLPSQLQCHKNEKRRKKLKMSYFFQQIPNDQESFPSQHLFLHGY